jgi:dodecin
MNFKSSPALESELRWRPLIPEFTSEGAARVCKLRNLDTREDVMAKKQADTVYKIVEVVGVSDKSWEEAGRRAVETAAGSLRDLRVAEVTKMDMRVEDGKVAAFRTRVSLSFKYES